MFHTLFKLQYRVKTFKNKLQGAQYQELSFYLNTISFNLIYT